MSPEEMKLRELADEQIGKREELIKTITPTGEFSKSSVNALIGAINKVIPLLDKTVPPLKPVKEDISGPMPEDLATRFFAVGSALKDYDSEGDYELPGKIASDEDLVAVVMVFDKASKDKGFKKFLSQPVPQPEGMEEEAMGEEGKSSMSPEQETEIEIMFGKE